MGSESISPQRTIFGWLFGVTILGGAAVLAAMTIYPEPVFRSFHGTNGTDTFSFVAEPQEKAGRAFDYPFDFSTKRRGNPVVMRAFKTVVGINSKATVRILNEGRQIVMGTVVDPAGWVITKASELRDKEFSCRCWDDRLVTGTEILRRDDLDLALVRIDRNEMPVVQWSEEEFPPVGAWLATTGTREIPQAIGVVSVAPRAIPAERAILGVQLAAGETGAVIVSIVPGSGADQAGLEVDDVVEEVNGEALKTRSEVLKAIGKNRAGQRLKLAIQRAGKRMEIVARLMDLNPMLMDVTEAEVNGEISARSSGFDSVFQHDTVIEPSQCGGPVVDLKGDAIGINIARAGRVSTYALPADVVKKAVKEMLEEASRLTDKPKVSQRRHVFFVAV